MTCIYHFNIIQSIFTALEVLCNLPIHSFTHYPIPTYALTVSIVFPFPESHMVGITKYNTLKIMFVMNVSSYFTARKTYQLPYFYCSAWDNEFLWAGFQVI